MNILKKMFQDLHTIDSDILAANENYFVSAYITDFNSFKTYIGFKNYKNINICK